MGVVDNIRKQAKSNGTKIQSSDEAKLEKMFNKAFYLPHNVEEEVKFVNMVMTRGLETQERSGLHASSILASEKSFCEREQVLSLLYKQLQGKQIQAGLMRIFEQGNAIHEKWQRLFIRAGWSSWDELDFTQYSHRYMMSFTPDIICSIPSFYDGKMIGEIKSVNTYQFKKMERHPSAWKQCQWYMYLTGITKGFVLSEDKNTQDFKIELYDYDKKIVAPWIERAEQVVYDYYKLIDKHKLVKRPTDATDSNCKRCKECAMRDACWNVGMGRVRLDQQ